MVAVYRAPMRSRNDAVELQATIDRARRLGLCGFGQSVSRSAEQERLARRVARFAELNEGSFVWTRDTDGWFWLGRISGPYFYDADETAAGVDLVHVPACEWLSTPILEPDMPAAVIATFRRDGRNFQEIHHPSINEQTQRIWDAQRSR
ncbi:GAF domain-containing protein [Mycobacterium sp.]|uniref:GAF domain-containing protein n=1 Tax=Mycobacterium sp. TaxID=1785 RepID=UPI003C71D951